jgi:predicted phosphodiesterase
MKFIQNVFIPYLKHYNIKHVIHLGDLVENKRQINIQTGARLREDFLQSLDDLDINVHIIAGNHDIFYKSTNSINSLREIVDGKYKFNIYDNKPSEIIIDNVKILLVPWISPENKEQSLKFITTSSAKYCMAHLELKGFEQQKGRLATHGDDHKIFDRFDAVFSGHYHIRSHRDNIYYIGSAFHFNWGDYSNFCGFMELDLETDNKKWIKNPYRIFSKIDYDEENLTEIQDLKDTYCRVNVVNKQSESKFNDYINSINELGVIDLLINDNVVPIKLDNNEIIQIDNTLDIFKNSINQLDIENKNDVELLIEDVYKEALETT